MTFLLLLLPLERLLFTLAFALRLLLEFLRETFADFSLLFLSRMDRFFDLVLTLVLILVFCLPTSLASANSEVPLVRSTELTERLFFVVSSERLMRRLRELSFTVASSRTGLVFVIPSSDEFRTLRRLVVRTASLFRSSLALTLLVLTLLVASLVFVELARVLFTETLRES